MPGRLLAAYGRLKHSRWYDERELYLAWEQLHLRRLLRHCAVDCVFDVGANAGQYARMLRAHAGYRGRIISFEPIPDLAAALRRMAQHDVLWHVEEIALASSDGTQPFNVMQSSQFSSLSQPQHTETGLFKNMNRVVETLDVRTESLKTAYARLQCQFGFERPFLKLDTQGYDAQIVAAARDVLPRFVGLQSELAVRRIYESSVDFREALSLYEGCGFALSAFVPNNAGHFPELIETDCIMVRRDLVPHRPISAPMRQSQSTSFD